jgi:hypothetical protein
MVETDVQAFVVAFGAGIGLFLVAGLRWLQSDWPRATRLGAAGLTLLGPAIAPVAVGYPLYALIPLGVVGLATARTLSRRADVQSLALIAAGLSLVAVSLSRFQPAHDSRKPLAGGSATVRELGSPLSARVESLLRPAELQLAKTDCGRAVRLGIPSDPQPADVLAATEHARITELGFTERVLRVAPASDKCDCFGWVFAGGKFHLTTADVEAILMDNGYVAKPVGLPGDIVIYRDRGRIVHVAIVSFPEITGQQTLVTSKWGWLGAIYVHAVGDSDYGKQYTYFNSARASHLLAGLDSKVALQKPLKSAAE